MFDRRLQSFRNLVSLAAADGKIEDIERITLAKIAFDRGIPLDRMNLMLERAKEYTYVIPLSQDEREEQMEEMISFAMVDGDFANAERELIFMVGNRLGFSNEEIERLIEENI